MRNYSSRAIRGAWSRAPISATRLRLRKDFPARVSGSPLNVAAPPPHKDSVIPGRGLSTLGWRRGTMPEDVIRVLLADDHAVVRAGLRAVLGSARDISVIGEASNGREAIAFAQQLKPDVIVMDLSMPEMDGTAATRAIIASGAPTRILVLSMHAEDEYLIQGMDA